MSDPTQQTRQPTQEELQAYLQQLRGADVAEIVVQAYTVLGTGAEVKLGRPDARTVIDAMLAMVNALQGRIEPQLHQQMTSGVNQLQIAQVEAERKVAAQQAAPQQGTDQAAQSGQGAEGPAPAAGQPSEEAAGAGPGGEAQQRMTDRLWIPGRDPRPPGR
jgi:hypothetical protein